MRTHHLTKERNWKMVENKYKIHTKAFEEILNEETRLRKLTQRFPKGSDSWNRAWDKLDLVLKRKKAYEEATLRNRGGLSW